MSEDRTLRVFAAADQLASVTRFSRDRMINRENVLEHIGFCTFYATLLAKRSTRKVDVGKLLQAVALHELDEIGLGDISRTTKYFDPAITEEFKRIEEKSVAQFSEWIRTAVLYQWEHAKDDDVEGRIMRVADLAAVVYKCWVEIALLGNQSFKRVAKETHTYVVLMFNEFYDKSADHFLIDELGRLMAIANRLVEDTKFDESEHFFTPIAD